MVSKQLVLQAIHSKEVERVPWVPFVGCHAARLIGISAEEYFKDGKQIAAGAAKAFELYKPDGLPVIFDLQLEAEAMGCDLRFSKENPPSIVTHPLEDGLPLKSLKIPGESDGRFPAVLEAAERICSTLGKDIAIYGLVTGPFTLAMHLMGTDIFFDMADDPVGVTALMQLTKEVCKNTARMYIERGVDVIALVDPMVSQISPDSFHSFVTPAATDFFSYVRSLGAASSFFVCGNTKRNVEGMCKCGPDNISIDENIPLDYVKQVATQYGLSFGGNIQLTVTMLFGTPADNIRDAKNCLEIGGNKGFILSPGCDMPFATPIGNVQAISRLARGEEIQLESDVDLPDWMERSLPIRYTGKDIIVDIITLGESENEHLDMAISVCRANAQTKCIEHRIQDPETVAIMIKMGLKHVPSVLINGEVLCENRMPGKTELDKAIKEAAAKK